MAKSMIVEVNPSVFKWLRVSSGWSVNDVSKRLRTSVVVIEAIEEGKRKPTLRQLKELSNAYQRPLALFLLSKPLKEPSLPKDFRMLPNRKDQFDRKTLLAIRKARNFQEISSELSNNIDYSIIPNINRVTVKNDPHYLAMTYRDYFQITGERIQKFKTAYPLFSYLRDKFEDLNILVFQFSMPIEDARGFSLTDMNPNVIVVNTADIIEARLFSMMHEFGHVLLGDTIIDFPGFSVNDRNDVERWCNEFASAFLLPPQQAQLFFSEETRELTDTKTLRSLSNRLKVSKAMLLYNMLKLDFITHQELKTTLARFQPKIEDKEDTSSEEESKGGPARTADQRCLSEVGVKYASIVVNNYDKNFITYSDALNYLTIKSRHYDQVMAKAIK